MNDTTVHTALGCDTEALDSLLRGELSAVETYDQAMAKVEDPTVLARLRGIREDHAHAGRRLREQVTKFGGTPSTSSGPWGTFAAAVTGTAKVFGPGTALAALKQGEEHGINQYDQALENDGVNEECKRLIQTDLMPQCHKHVKELDQLIGGMK